MRVCVLLDARVELNRVLIVAMWNAGFVPVLRLRLLRVGYLGMLLLDQAMCFMFRCLVMAVSRRVRSTEFLFFSDAPAFEHVNFGAGDTTAVHYLNLQTGVQIKRGGGVVQHMRWNACIHKSPEKHISGYTGEAVQISDAHNEYSLTRDEFKVLYHQIQLKRKRPTGKYTRIFLTYV